VVTVLTKEPTETIVEAVVLVPAIEMPVAAVTVPASTTAELALDVLLITTEPALAVMVPVAVLLTPGLFVAVVLLEVAVKVMLPVVDVNEEVR
jgi:hypothetical protein